MKGDFTRFTFKPEKGYSSVRMQQGRVQLDADWNEHVEIRNHLERSESFDVIGASGAPRENGGFKLIVEGSDLAISRGRIYVDGILCENDVDNRACEHEEPRTCPSVRFSDQPHRTTQTLPNATGLYLFYLDVWERHVTAVEDPSIRETALGGPDTATRVKTIWQVKYLPVEDQNDQNVALTCWDVPDEWTQMLGETKGRMKARAEADEGTQDPCIVAAEAGYRRLENQLYRVEIHRSSGMVDSLGVELPPTFKWSRDNGMVLTRLIGIDIDNDKLLTVADPGKDSNLRIASGQWVEITDDSRVLEGDPGIMVRILSVEGNVLEIESWPSGAPPVLDMATATVRRWDHKGKDDQDLSASGGALPLVYNTWIDLEDGIQVRFESGGTYNTGDYWLIPARVVGGDVEWPRDEISEEPLYQPPRGIHHHYCRLALVSVNVPDSLTPPLEVVCDARPLFPALNEPDLYYVSGDGQEAMPGEFLPQSLRVGVVNCNRPVEGAWILFEIKAGNGALVPPLIEDPTSVGLQFKTATVVLDKDGTTIYEQGEIVKDTSGTPIQDPKEIGYKHKSFIVPTHIVTTGIAATEEMGIARCSWRLEQLPPETLEPDQLVEATLYKLPEAKDEYRLDVPVVFGASFGVAWQDRYGGSSFPDIPHPSLKVQTVEKALDQLRENTALHYVGGDGQEARRGQQLPKPLEVRVANGQWPRAGAKVRFEVLVDSLGADGMLEDENGNTGTSLDVTTDVHGDGIARVFWTPNKKGKDSQRVIATLVDPIQPTNGRQGVVHFNASLSIAEEVTYDGSSFPDIPHPGLQVDTVEDALDQLRENTALHYVGGDGQEARRGEQLPKPLEVRVANGQWPRESAIVRFQLPIDPLGEGTLKDDNGNTGISLDVPTSADGIARVFWTPNGKGRDSQRVTATLKSPLQPTNGAQGVVHFNANLSVAKEVTYDGSVFPDGQHTALAVDTVEDALDQIRQNIALRYVGGDGQESPPLPKPPDTLTEVLPSPLRVRVAKGHWPFRGAVVKFQVTAGLGVIRPTGDPGELLVETDLDGIAECRWRLDTTNRIQEVTATLVKPVQLPEPANSTDPTAGSLRFTARLSRMRLRHDGQTTIDARKNFDVLLYGSSEAWPRRHVFPLVSAYSDTQGAELAVSERIQTTQAGRNERVVRYTNLTETPVVLHYKAYFWEDD